MFGGLYYLNNFDNMFTAAGKAFVIMLIIFVFATSLIKHQFSVTLFELTVVNNWYVIMEGYAVIFSEWSRLYFMIFYIVTMVRHKYKGKNQKLDIQYFEIVCSNLGSSFRS